MIIASSRIQMKINHLSIKLHKCPSQLLVIFTKTVKNSHWTSWNQLALADSKSLIYYPTS